MSAKIKPTAPQQPSAHDLALMESLGIRPAVSSHSSPADQLLDPTAADTLAFTPKPRDHGAPRAKLSGYNVRQTSRGITVIEIDWWAHPMRDQAWADNMRKTMPSEGHWRREFCRDWSVSSGSTYYPEFAAQAGKYILRCEGLANRSRSPILRGWDFGISHPACIWLQVDETRRVWVLRELLGVGIDLYSFRDLVLYLSGQRPLSYLVKRPAAMQVIKELEGPWDRGHGRRFKGMPAYARVHPWFDDGPYLDFSGHEALQRSGLVEGENKSAHQVLAAEGVHCSSNYTLVKTRTTVFRKLMHFREDGYPGILFDPACTQLILGFGGGITTAPPTKDNPDPDVPVKDGWYEHYHEALGYPITQVIGANDASAPPQTGQWVGRTWVVNPHGQMRPYTSTR